ncbi:aminopeptidase P family protein [Sunxiuqinia dokdonensis]|uniref:Xaa-Pro aminopeptidase n=1 Tax=Sunxiuqinia dokdonensis TaxID=1409788 RepID=A0A0L8V525_9BACT|nr:aminopeptidase P family protein [Sunxiuqinia dokdonensis]KOH43585.1 xaa-Pro aminopeptidase [Sunxiuqinia dokdonensis]
MFNREIYIERRRQLRDQVSGGLILILGNSDSPMNYKDNTYHFRQDSNFLYFFGLDFQNLAGLIDVDSGEEMLFGDDFSMDDIIWMGPQESMQTKAARVGIKKALAYQKLFSQVGEAVKRGRKIHFTPPYRADNQLVLLELTGIAPSHQKAAASLELIQAIVSLRSVKDAGEIEELQKAAAAGYQMHVAAMKMAMPGTWEQKIAGTIEGISLANGNPPSFPIILSQNGETLHNHDHSNVLEKGRLLLVDAGAQTSMHYASDFTRTSPVGGQFSQQQREIYEIVLQANNLATELAKPGASYLSIHLEAAKVIASGMKALGLMKGDVDEAVQAGAHALFMPHGLGHMMGLDVHDMEDLGQIYVGYDEEIRPVSQFGTAALRLGRKLQPGFVITNEPGIYFIPALIDQWKSEKTNHEFINFDRLEAYRTFGGIRLEDDLLITETACELIGERIPITPEEVESTMK